MAVRPPMLALRGRLSVRCGMPSIIEAAGTGERAGHAPVGAAQRKRSLVDLAMQSRTLPDQLCAHTGRATRRRLPSARSRADRAHSPSCTSLPSRRAMRSRSSLDVNVISMVPCFSVPWMFTVVPKRLPRRWDRADAAQ